MDVRFILVSIPDSKKKSLIARRVARLPHVGMSRALSMLDHLPATIFGRIAYDEAASLAKDLEAMGCLVRMEPLEQTRVLRASAPPDDPVQGEDAPEIPKKPYAPRPPVVYASKPEEPDRPITSPKPVRRLSGAWIGGACVVFVVGISFWVVPLLSKAGQTRRTLQKAERRMEQHPEDTTAVEAALSAYAELAQSEKSMAKRIEHLTRAVRLRSDDGMLRSMLARAYADSASRLLGQEMRVRFYQIAISFNQYNEAAWDGLISAYEEMGKTDLAQEARLRKISIFGESQEGLDQILGAYGEALYSPVVRNDTLFVVYQSRKQKPDAILRETYVMCQDFRPLRPASGVKLDVFVRGKRALTVTTSLRSIPDDFVMWKKKTRVIKTGS